MSSAPREFCTDEQTAVFAVTENYDEPGLATVTPCGVLDDGSTPLLQGMLDRSWSRWPDELLLDLRQVTFVNARGLRCLFGATRRAQQRHQRLILWCHPGPVARLVVLVGLADWAQIELPAHSAAQSAHLSPATTRDTGVPALVGTVAAPGALDGASGHPATRSA